MKTAKAQDEETVFKAAKGKRLTGYRQRETQKAVGISRQQVQKERPLQRG